jgi:hypothetical protein
MQYRGGTVLRHLSAHTPPPLSRCFGLDAAPPRACGSPRADSIEYVLSPRELVIVIDGGAQVLERARVRAQCPLVSRRGTGAKGGHLELTLASPLSSHPC